MEIIIGLLVVWVISALFSSGSNRETIADHPLVAKIETENRDGRSIKTLYVKGAPKAQRSANISMIVKLYDDPTGLPLLSAFHEFSEADTRVFEHIINIGDFSVGTYWPDWIPVCGFLDEMIISPHKGKRLVEAIVVVFETNNPPKFVAGVLSTGTGKVINSIGAKYSHTFNYSGYAEIDTDRLKIQETSVELAIITAMSDGTIQDEEGSKIKEWIRQIVDATPESFQDQVKDSLNTSLERGFNKVKRDPKTGGRSFMDSLTEEIRPISSEPEKYDLLELCLDVIAADGKAEKGELEFINLLADKVGVDYLEFTKLKDRQLIEVEGPTLKGSKDEGIDESTGIQPNWSAEEKRKFIVREYSKWNNRIPTLKGKQKELAQERLANLAKAKKKYG